MKPEDRLVERLTRELVVTSAPTAKVTRRHLSNKYQAHPAQPDTPDESGTSEDGTRQTDDNTTSTED